MEYGLNATSHSDKSHAELCDYIDEIRVEMPDASERMLNGVLRSKGSIVRLQELRDAIHAVDPINTALWWSPQLMHQPYSVPGPNSQWDLGRAHALKL